MDFGFVNSILRARFFPPLDMWLTKSPDYTGGYFINYYYYGHYITAFLTKLAGIDSSITYNLMMATLFAFAFCLSFSIGANMYYLLVVSWREKFTTKYVSQIFINLRIVLVGLLAAFLVALGGNLHTLYVLTSGYPNENPEPPWNLSLGYHPDRYWYPNATRFIPFTIHEFPIYSFVVADLHGHVSNIPLVLLTIAFLLHIIVSQKPKLETLPDKNSSVNKLLNDFQNHTSFSLPHLVFLAILLASMYMTNAWDGPIYMILSGLVFLYINFRGKKNQRVVFSEAIYKTFSASLFLVFFFLLATLPFSLNFKLFVSGIGVLCSPKFLFGKSLGPFLFEAEKCQKSPIWMLIILWGFFYYNVLAFLFFTFISHKKTAFSNKMPPQGYHFPIIKKVSDLLKNLIDAGKNLYSVDIFIILIIFLSSLLLIFPEFFYMKDIYPAHYRANTMFKLGYQAFIMLGLASAYIVFRLKLQLLRHKPKLSYIFYRSLFILLFALVAIYPYFAINSYYGSLQVYHGLYGLKWMSTQYPDDLSAIEWLRKNINCTSLDSCNNQPVIVEANGDSYTDYARVSANTGLPTIVGWPVHEWLWRGSYDEAGKRIPEVAVIYESKDVNQTKEILKKYQVEYIFLGNLEREKYKNINEEKLEQLGKVIFESGSTKIYRVYPIVI